jgi:paraquat-inducible protein B
MNQDELAAVPEATLAPLKRLSGLWLIPLLTLLLGLGMIYQNWAGRGPLISISFPTAAGLEAGQTLIRTREVEIGRVEDITLNAQVDGVIVTARIDKEFSALLAEDSAFWVVEPTISLSGVSGLNTLVSGQYIRFEPGSSARVSEDFTGLAQAPLTPAGTPGLRLTLTTDQDYAFAKGDPIMHLGLRVGKIEDFRFDVDTGRIYYDAFIEAPFHELVNANTRFWKNSALRAEVSSAGFELEAASLNSVLTGGISFTTLAGEFVDEAAPAQQTYYIYPGRNAIADRQFEYGVRYWVMLEGSVSGLAVEAPVMYRGIQVGHILRIDYVPQGRNLLDPTLDLPVLIEIHPGRLGLPDAAASLQRAEDDIETWIRQGLSATTRSQNLLLGQQYIELVYGAPPSDDELDLYRELVVIPSGVDTIQKFTDSIEELITKLNQLPIEGVLGSVEQLARDASTTLAQIERLAEAGSTALGSDQNAVLLGQLEATLGAVQRLADSYADDSRASRDLQGMLDSVTQLADELRPLAVELRNKPSSLVFPGSTGPEREPRRQQP